MGVRLLEGAREAIRSAKNLEELSRDSFVDLDSRSVVFQRRCDSPVVVYFVFQVSFRILTGLVKNSSRRSAPVEPVSKISSSLLCGFVFSLSCAGKQCPVWDYLISALNLLMEYESCITW